MPSSPERLVLFDVDCTLIDARGAGSRSIPDAIREVYGLHGSLDGYSFHGLTDPRIVRDLVIRWGGDPEDVDARMARCLERYVELLRDEVAAAGVRVLPGVPALLEALAADRRVVLGLLTGNVEAGAALKLGPTGLARYFRLGAYGSDAERRDELPAVAVARAATITGRRFTGRDVVIIGDTPADVTCGAHLGVTTVAVATGRHSVADLRAAGADHVFADFGDWQSVRAAILS